MNRVLVWKLWSRLRWNCPMNKPPLPVNPAPLEYKWPIRIFRKLKPTKETKDGWKPKEIKTFTSAFDQCCFAISNTRRLDLCPIWKHPGQEPRYPTDDERSVYGWKRLIRILQTAVLTDKILANPNFCIWMEVNRVGAVIRIDRRRTGKIILKWFGDRKRISGSSFVKNSHQNEPRPIIYKFGTARIPSQIWFVLMEYRERFCVWGSLPFFLPFEPSITVILQSEPTSSFQTKKNVRPTVKYFRKAKQRRLSVELWKSSISWDRPFATFLLV